MMFNQYQKFNQSQSGIEKQPELYQLFYNITPKGEEELRGQLSSNPRQLDACRNRLAELEELLKHDDNRCHTSREQCNFLKRVLSSY